VNKLMKIITPLAVLGVGFGSYAALQVSKPEPQKRDEVARPVSVFVETVSESNVSLDVQTQGEVRSRIAIDLVAQVGGRILHVSDDFTEGGAVVPGVALITIERTDYLLALSQAEAREAEAKVALELALAGANVARQQLRGTSKPSDLALKKPQVAEAQARLKAAEANLAQARLNLSRTNVSLPFAGRISQTYVDVGQYVAPGTPLGRAFATDRVEVRLPLNNTQLASLGLPIGYVAEKGAGLDVDLSAMVAGLQQQWRGKLVRLDASLDSSTRLLYASVEVDDPYGANVSEHNMPLAVGLYVNATIRGRELSNAVSIPRGALRAGNTVYLVGSNGQLEIRTLSITHSSDTIAVVRDGLSAGEQIIISTLRNPLRGMPVQAANPGTGQYSGTAVVGEGQG
jgi:RND family efflux transporter MFP subunit